MSVIPANAENQKGYDWCRSWAARQAGTQRRGQRWLL